MKANKLILIAACLFLFNNSVVKAQDYTPSSENRKAREWFQEAKFGLFIHWGVYSLLGDGEWVMNDQNIAISEYEKLPAFFNPTAFDPNEWVSLVKKADIYSY